MIEVSPIKSVKKINYIKKLLSEKWKIRLLVLFSIGINSALRISNLLSIQVKHLFKSDWTVKDSFEIQEKKTKKKHKVTFPPKTKKAIELYKKTYPSNIENEDNYIFFRAKSNEKWQHHISRVQGWKNIGQRCRAVWLEGNYWGHSFRKTQGWMARSNGVPLSVIQHKLNHSSQKVALKYIGITQEEVDEAVYNLDL